jgi:DNA-directed RNA polymerase specialized sigma24 family protein
MKEMQTNGLTLEQELERYKSWLEDLHIRYDELKKEHSETKKELETVSKKSVEQCYKDSKLIGLLETKNIQLEKAHEELKQDVKRFFELRHYEELTKDELYEMCELEEQLSAIGVENE